MNETTFDDLDVQILRGVAGGHSRARIAADLSIGAATVSRRITSMRARTESVNRIHLAVWAVREGII